MHLSPASCKRFYRLIDALSLYAKERLSIPDFPGDSYSPDFPLFSNQFRREVDKVLWQCPDVIDDFVRENPYGLDGSLLAEALSWKVARPRFYVLWKHEGGRSVFMGAEGTFSVMGLAQDIYEIIPNTPKLVEATLLPFEGSVVYGVVIMEYPSEMLSGALKVQQDIFEAEKTKGISCSARDLIRLSREFNERKAEEELDDFWEDISRQNDVANGRETLPEGMHRGILAGLSEEERERRVLERVGEVDTFDARAFMLDALKERAFRAKPVSALSDQLMLETKKRLLDFAPVVNLRRFSKLRKQELADLISAVVADSGIPRMMDNLVFCSESHFKSVRMAFESADDITFSAEEAADKAQGMFPFTPFVALFLHGGTFTLSMSPEVRSALKEIDWGQAAALRKRKYDIIHCAQVCTEVYGLIAIDDFAEQVEKWYGHRLDYREMLSELTMTLLWGEEDYTFWSPGDVMYLASIELSDAGTLFDPDVEEDMEYLEDYRKHLLDRHARIPRRKLDPALSEMELIDWEMKLPSTLRLRNYLDAHVPDGEDDCFFAESVIEDLIMYSVGPVDPSFTAEYLAERGLLDDEKSANTVLALASGLVNGLPKWENNGWSPQELLEKETGQKMFFNEDGSRVKAGRNDPCPCGSGKKYKKCCGR